MGKSTRQDQKLMLLCQYLSSLPPDPPKNTYLRQVPEGAIKENSHVTLQCSSQGNPPIQNYTWDKDGEILQHITQRELVFLDIKPRNSGIYHCRVQNLLGSAESQPVPLNVQYPPKHVQLALHSTLPIKEGNTVTLNCSVGSSNPSFCWYRWYKQEAAGSETPFKYDKPLLSFSASRESSRFYRCGACNLAGCTLSGRVEVNVLYPPKGVEVKAVPGQAVQEGTKLLLQCIYNSSNPEVYTSVGSSNPSFCWYRWYKQEAAGSETPFKYDKPLLSFSASRESSCFYRCGACNFAGCTLSGRVEVNVLFAPKDVKIVQMPAGDIKEGSPVQLRCDVGPANPKEIQYAWYKDQEPAYLSRKKNSPASTLTIQNVTSKDSGIYECKVNNTVGFRHSLGLKLNVQYGPRDIQVSVDPVDTITEGKDVSLECSNDANPAANRYRWYWNRKAMPREASKILFLRKVQVKHSGEYHCKASNIISEGASQPVNLAVYYSRTTMLKHTAIGFGAALAMIIMLGLLLYILRRAKKRVLPGASRSQRVASVFMKKSKQVKLCNNNNQPSQSMEDSIGFLNQGAEEAISYATIQFPPSVSKERTIYARINQPIPSSDPSNEAVVYSELKKPRLPPKGDPKADYENVGEVKGEELHYSSLVNLTPRPKPIFDDSETDSESEESIQYATLKH
ncbi:B-cell receptor CD22-like [Varanus komodoensis]|uniref:B-cell receptor CD22-like n=1 Tax=Varanus komodoensis TaxID=61221 RepID=UPI001CF7CABC|nr:B-cell receptor CD22-like [Varanus komodoensis]